MAAESKTDLNSKTLVRYALRAVMLGLVVMGVVLYLTSTSDTIDELFRFPLKFIPLILVLACGSWFCSGARLWVLARSLGYKMTLFQGLITGMAAEFGVAATPGGIGGTAVRLLFMKKSGVPLTVGASILTADGVLDVSFFVALIPFALAIMVRDPSWAGVIEEFHKIPFGVILAVITVVCLVMVLLFKKSGRWVRRVEAILHRMAWAHKRRLAGRVRYAQWKSRGALIRILETTGFMFRRNPLVLLLVFGITAAQWLCRYGILPVILLAFSGKQSFLPILVMQGMFLVVSFMILLPGGGGTVEMITTLVLRQFVPLPAVGVVLIIWRFFTYHLYMLAGGIVFFAVWHRLDAIFPPVFEECERPSGN